MRTSSAPIRLEPLPLRRRGRAKGAEKARRAKARSPLGLAELRARNGVSLSDIAERTCIPLHHLEELERGDISHWPAGVYAKSWARDYAREAGLDPGKVAAFVAPLADVEVSTADIKEAHQLRERLVRGRARFGRGSALLARIATVIVVLVLLALGAIYWWNRTAPEAAGAPARPEAGARGAAAPPAATSGLPPR